MRALRRSGWRVSEILCSGRHSENRTLSRGSDNADAKADRFQARRASRLCLGELGLRKFLEGLGHTFVVTSDKEGATSVFERELPDAEIVISQPFWPAYLTAERIAKAKKLKLAITAGIGSDHVDLQAAIKHGVTVAEVTYSNSISVSEHVVMMILSLVRNYIPSYKWVIDGGLEHRRLRVSLLRSRSDGSRYGWPPDESAWPF